MLNIKKNLMPVLLVLAVAGFFIWQYYQNPKALEAQAKQGVATVYEGFTCDEPIPLGETTANTQKLISQVQGKYDETRVSLDMAISNISSVLAALNENQQGVCDFKKCAADVTDKGPDASIEVQTGVTQPLGISGHIANCQENEAKGEPCPDISELAKKIGEQKAAIDGYRKQIKEIFETATIALPDDLKMESDKTGPDFAAKKITLPDLIVRQANYSEAWLTPTDETGWQRSCALTQGQQAKVAREEMGNVAPVRCREALENEWYWPKASSPLCLTVCKDGPTDSCKKCLSIDPGPSGSVLAKVNYRIYGTCKDRCKDDLTSDCEQCICQKQDGSAMTYEECVGFLCGDIENYVCCHEKPLEIQYYIADEADFETYPGMSTGGHTISNIHMTAYSPPEFSYDKCGANQGCCASPPSGGCPYGCCTRSGKIVGYGDIAINKANMPLGSWVKIKKLADAKTGEDKSSFQIDGRVLTEDNLYFCAADTGGGIHANEIDLWLPDHPTADLFGNMTATVEWFYDPRNPCYKNKTRIDNPDDPMAALGFAPNLSSINYAFESAEGDLSTIYFQAGVADQASMASDNLSALLKYLAALEINGVKAAGNWSISSITDKYVGTDVALMSLCADPSTNDKYACVHTKNSCHYGGRNQLGKSYAFDLSVKYPENNVADAVAQAACAWGRANNVQVTVAFEKNPDHYHISVDNAIAGCDSDGKRSDNICNFR